MKNLILVLIIVFSISLTLIYLSNKEVKAEVCDLSATDIFFTSLLPGGTHDVDTSTTLTNMGDESISSISISGNDWDTPSGFLVSQTHYSESSESGGQLYGDMLELLSTPTSLTTTLPNNLDSASVYFRLQIPADQPAGDYQQTITFTFECVTQDGI